MTSMGVRILKKSTSRNTVGESSSSTTTGGPLHTPSRSADMSDRSRATPFGVNLINKRSPRSPNKKRRSRRADEDGNGESGQLLDDSSVKSLPNSGSVSKSNKRYSFRLRKSSADKQQSIIPQDISESSSSGDMDGSVKSLPPPATATRSSPLPSKSRLRSRKSSGLAVAVLDDSESSLDASTLLDASASNHLDASSTTNDMDASVRQAQPASAARFGVKLRKSFKRSNTDGKTSRHSTGQPYERLREEEEDEDDVPATPTTTIRDSLDSRSAHSPKTVPLVRGLEPTRTSPRRTTSSPNPTGRFSVASLPKISTRDFSGRRSAAMDMAKQRATSIKAMSTKDFKQQLRKEMKGIKAAKVKSFKARKKLSEMGDIEQVSEMARKAEEFRRRRQSQAGGSLRSSLTSFGSLDSCSDHNYNNTSSTEFDTAATCMSTPSTPNTVTICAFDESTLDSEELKLPLTMELAEEPASTTIVGELEPIIESKYSGLSSGSGEIPAFAAANAGDDNEKMLPNKIRATKSATKSLPLEELLNEASSATSATASLMTHEEDDGDDGFFGETTPHNKKSVLECWEEEFDELEESNKLLEERIAMLQQSLGQAHQAEAEDMQQVRDNTDKKKQEVARVIRKEHAANEAKMEKKLKASIRMSKIHLDNQDAMIDALQVQNKSRRRESQSLNLQVLSLLQCGDRLRKATKETKEYTRELEQLLLKPAQEKQDSLLVEVQGCELERKRLEREIRRSKKDADQERQGRRAYARYMARLMHEVQHQCWTDHNLLAAINQIPPTKNTREEWDRTKSEANKKEEPKRTSIFGWW